MHLRVTCVLLALTFASTACQRPLEERAAPPAPGETVTGTNNTGGTGEVADSDWESNLDGALAEALEESQILILGEMHGNNTGPEALWRSAQVAVDNHGAVSIGLEAPEESVAFSKYLASEGSEADRDALLKDPFWAPAAYDGRPSEDLLKMLEQARKARTAGADIEVFGFLRAGAFEPDDQNPHEERMANAIVEVARAKPDRKIVALVGNLHAGLKAVQFDQSKPPIIPMAARVREAIGETATIKLEYGGGTTLARTREGLQELKLTPVEKPDQPINRLEPNSDFDATWWVGEARPSISPIDRSRD